MHKLQVILLIAVQWKLYTLFVKASWPACIAENRDINNNNNHTTDGWWLTSLSSTQHRKKNDSHICNWTTNTHTNTANWTTETIYMQHWIYLLRVVKTMKMLAKFGRRNVTLFYSWCGQSREREEGADNEDDLQFTQQAAGLIYDDLTRGVCLSWRRMERMRDTSFCWRTLFALKSQRRPMRSHSWPGTVSSRWAINSLSASLQQHS